jgi:hypothetical protein
MEIGAFIEKWRGVKGGQERANYGLFLTEFCHALDLPVPQPAEAGTLGDYQFEGPVQGGGAGGNTGAIDLYKKGHFILEAKQSKLPAEKKQQPEFFDTAEDAPTSPSGARYDRLMRDALAQAKRYAVNLPSNHPWPPFLIVCDVGRAFELYFDWSGNGRGYSYFPDQQSYRFDIGRFAEDDVQDIFKALWTDPASIDPRAKSAEVSRGIARRLADVSKWLEEQQKHKTREDTDFVRSMAIEETALFLMRIIFCMFAEDVELIPKGSFSAFLEKAKDNEAAFEPELRQLWQVMATDGGERYSFALGTDVRFFNGGLFSSAHTYRLSNADIGELYEAAKADWRKVEPAIFGTLLEQALTASERSKLGAHYTPRPYVQRIVQATIMDVLEPEWEAAQSAEDPLAAATAFHQRITALRILDPACGTGNFLYVALENLMRLEGDVIESIRQLGGSVEPMVGPQQFLGLELNPRAAVIAELVLWIGWLRLRMQNDPDAAPNPVLKQFGNINFGGHAGYDAVLRRTSTGAPDTDSPMIPNWPEADFIIGNPPFIGGKDIRKELDGDYAEALWKANPRVAPSADFVMQWWDRAAHLLIAENSPLIRFGFVTTNSITQTFSRRVIESYMKDQDMSLILAIPDHPWTKATKDAAAVRIAMTVAARGQQQGQLIEVVSETGLETDSPIVQTRETRGRINPDLSLGTDVTKVSALKANEGMSSPGVKLHGAGFIVTLGKAAHLGLGTRDGLDQHIRPYRNGRDLLQNSRGAMVIDLFGLDEKAVRTRFPEVYQHLLTTVKPERDINRRDSYRLKWWIHGEPRKDLRQSLAGLDRYIATVETAKHRTFQFLDASILPDNMLIAIGTDSGFHLGVLSSSVNMMWVAVKNGSLGVTPRYNKTICFDPFPFPDATAEHRAAIAELAEELDETRKVALAEVPGLTMTEIYNLREKLLSGAALSRADQDRATAARAGIIHRLHEQIDAAVADAYGWADDYRNGDLAPSEIVARLVALNAERAAEEAAGHIRWLRPDYQIPRFAK